MRRFAIAPSSAVVIGSRLDLDGGQFDYVGAEIVQKFCQCAGLFARACNDDPLPEERQLFIPAQLVAQPYDFADHDSCGRLHSALMDQAGKRIEGAGDDLLIRASGPANSHRRRVGGAPAAIIRRAISSKCERPMKITRVSEVPTFVQSI